MFRTRVCTQRACVGKGSPLDRALILPVVRLRVPDLPSHVCPMNMQGGARAVSPCAAVVDSACARALRSLRRREHRDHFPHSGDRDRPPGACPEGLEQGGRVVELLEQ
jgi:hypothetical protein